MNENLHSSVHSPILSPIHPLSLKSQNILSALLYNLSRSSRQILVMYEMFLLYNISRGNRRPESKTFLQNCSCRVCNSNTHSNYERHEKKHLYFAFYFWRSENIKIFVLFHCSLFIHVYEGNVYLTPRSVLFLHL